MLNVKKEVLTVEDLSTHEHSKCPCTRGREDVIEVAHAFSVREFAPMVGGIHRPLSFIEYHFGLVGYAAKLDVRVKVGLAK